uniref:cell surface A33 antigen-like isoform X2 n=1 Tax=Gasterosteus aculeatus aculeatus TaxID=481459 RepID=UPI001A99C649|nr:cell surface A33 antigen-like isoform X2 [Gasterosteus aculeatus aculeatus]
MEALAMERRISPWILLSLVLSGVDALNVNIPTKLYEVARGDNITLPCKFIPKTPGTPQFVVITWYGEGVNTDPDETLIVTYYSAGDITDVKPLYEGRVSLDVDIKTGKADLKLSSITLDDNKEFRCQVQIPEDKEGKLAGTTRLVVLVAPSTPVCAIKGNAEYGENVNLTCLSVEGSPAPVYTWKSLDVLNNPPRTTDKGGIMSLYNISKETSGYYICTSTNKIRSATCNITLAVMPPSMKIGSTAGIVAGVAALLIVVIIGICCCYCRKKKLKKEEEEYAMGVREEEHGDQKPAKNGVTQIDDGQEDDRVHDDSSLRRPFVSTERHEERSERDYDDRRSEYDDRRSEYDDRRSEYDDRRSDYTDRRSDYDDRRDRPGNRNERYDDRRYDDDDRRRRYDDDRKDRRVKHDDDRHDERYDDRDLVKPPVPANKPPKKDFRD